MWEARIAKTFIALGLNMIQGYGLTEAAPVVAANREGDNDPLSVGKPLPGIEVRLNEALELPLRGPSVMQGYWSCLRSPRRTTRKSCCVMPTPV
jgi:long-chain acyl-CoA synthetase